MNKNTKPFIPFSKPSISELEIDDVVEVMKSGWLTSGSKAISFEEEFGDFISPQDKLLEAISVNSATAGLHLALEACGVGYGDEIITTSLTFTATAEVARYLGAEARFVDIDPTTMNIDVKKIEAQISPRTKVIIPVHYAGLSCDMDEILEIAKKYNLKVVEDAAHALPSTYKKNIIGNLESDSTVFSFYANKNMTTGEGGMIVTKDKEMAKKKKKMRLHGIDRDAFSRFTDKKASWYYEVVEAGYKYNLTDVAAAIGRVQLRRLPEFLKMRQIQADFYLKELEGLNLQLPYQREGDTHSWHLFVIRLTDKHSISRDNLIKELNTRGIGTSVHYVPLHLQPYWKNRYNLKKKDFKNAQNAFDNMISLPLYPELRKEDQIFIVDSLKDILNA